MLFRGKIVSTAPLKKILYVSPVQGKQIFISVIATLGVEDIDKVYIDGSLIIGRSIDFYFSRTFVIIKKFPGQFVLQTLE